MDSAKTQARLARIPAIIYPEELPGDASRAYVLDFIETVKRESFARLPGVRAL